MAPWRSRGRSRAGLETAPSLLILLAVAAPRVALGLPGHPYPLDGNPNSGLGEDFNGNNVWTNGKQIGLKNSARAYMVKNCQANNWWGAGFQRFHLLGKTLTFTADLSAVGCGCVATLYFVAMGNPGPNANYCDIQQGHGYTPCFEVDIMEANSHAFHSSLHARQGDAHDGTCNARVGCIANLGRYPLTRTGLKTKDLYGPGALIDTKRAFQVEAVFDLYGSMRVTLHQDSNTVHVFNQSTAGNLASHDDDGWDLARYPKPGGVGEEDRKITASAMQQGLVLVASLWSGDTHWLDTSACGGSTFCNLGASWYTVTDLEVKASPVEQQTTAKTTEAPVPETAAKTTEAAVVETTTTDKPTTSPQTLAMTTALPNEEEANAKSAGDSCQVGDIVPCPDSQLNALCSGMQCCASADGQSFVCPSAPRGWNQCMGAKRVDCLAETTPTTTVQGHEAATTAAESALGLEALAADTTTTEHEATTTTLAETTEAATTTLAETTEATTTTTEETEVATTTTEETEAPTTTSVETTRTTTNPVVKDSTVDATTTTTVSATSLQQTASTTSAETTHESTASTTSVETTSTSTVHTQTTQGEKEEADQRLAEINAAMADAGGGSESEATTTMQPSSDPTTVSPDRTEDATEEEDEAAAAARAEEMADEVNKAMGLADETKKVEQTPASSNKTQEDASETTHRAEKQPKASTSTTSPASSTSAASSSTSAASTTTSAASATTSAASTTTAASTSSTLATSSTTSSSSSPPSSTGALLSTTLANRTTTASSVSSVEQSAEALSWQCHDYTGQNGDGWCDSVGSKDGWDFRFFKHGIGSICGGCWCCKRRSLAKEAGESVEPLPQEPQVLAEWRCHSYSSGQTDSWCSSAGYVGSYEYRLFNSSESRCGKPADGKPGCKCCKRKVASWQCHDYVQGQDDDWCKSVGVEGQYQYGFNGGVNSPCEGCWCCKREVASPAATPRQEQEKAPFKVWRHFEDLDIGENRACRGTNLHDDSPRYYEVHMNVLGIHDCMDRCRSAVALGKTCSGIEFSSARGGRCEVWHRRAGIGVTVPVMGVTCLRFGRKKDGWEAGVFSPADGGINRACRGQDQRDDEEEYYEIYTGMSNLGQCKARCQAEASLEGGLCRGIEFSQERGGRCEVWKRPQGIEVTVSVPGVTCLRFGILDEVSVKVKHLGPEQAVELDSGRPVVRTPEGLRAGPHVPLRLGHGAATFWAVGGLLLVLVAVLFAAPRRAWAAPAADGPEARCLLAVAGPEGASEYEGEA